MRILATLAAVALLQGACAASITGRDAKFKEAVLAFNEGVRWGRIEDVMSQVEPRSRPLVAGLFEGVGQKILISDYEILRTTLDLKKGEAVVEVQLVWYRVDDMEVRQTVLVQRWEERDRAWWVVAEEHRSGTPLLGT